MSADSDRPSPFMFTAGTSGVTTPTQQQTALDSSSHGLGPLPATTGSTLPANSTATQPAMAPGPGQMVLANSCKLELGDILGGGGGGDSLLNQQVVLTMNAIMHVYLVK